MKLYEIKDALNAEVIYGNDLMDVNIVGAAAADLMDDILAAVAKDAVLLTGLTSEQVLRTAKLAGVSAVVIVRGKKPSLQMIDAAGKYGISLLITEYSLFVASGRLYINGLRGLDGSW